MANKRMFSQTIVNSDAFLEMPQSTQCLYFHLGMVADDDGFVNSPKKIMRMVGSSEDDMKLLIAKKFLLLFDSGIIVIKHWRINNYLRKDRYQPTLYQEEKQMIEEKNNGAYTWKKASESLGIPMVYQRYTQNSIDKNRLVKNSIDEIIDEPTTSDFIGNKPTLEEVKLYCESKNYTFDVNEFYDYYDEVNWTASDSRHSFNWKKKCDLWQSNEKKKIINSKQVPVPEFMRDQADGVVKESKKPSEDLIAQIKAMQKEMEGDV